MNVVSLVLAICLMSFAHILRLFRWELFIKVYEKPDRKRLLFALSSGYILNYFVPYKLGDLFRGFIAGHRMKNGKALGLSTVIVDRYLDIFFVGLIFLILSFVMKDEPSFVLASRFYIIVFFSLILITLLVFLFRNILKKLVRFFAGLFNAKIEGSLLRFAWALIWNFKDIALKINKIKLLALSVGMWLVYIASYASFAYFYSSLGLETKWTDIFLMLFGENGVKASTIMISLFTGEAQQGQLWFVIYMIAPLIILLLISLLLKRFKSGNVDDSEYLNLLPQLNASERLVFLDKYFSGENREYVDNYLKINQGISIVRDYSAGSNATTMLCVDKDTTFFRKYAFGKDAGKLVSQIEWIEANKERLPLSDIIKNDHNEFYCFYDMAYNSSAVGMFEYAHSMPVEKSKAVLFEIFDRLENSIYRENASKAEKEIIEEYIREKVIKNLERIKSSRKIKNLYDYEEIIINGKTYKNLSHFEKYLTVDFLSEVFKEDTVSVIHGDLTLENIICVRKEGEKDDFYLIDPNTGNILDSPNIDYAKVLQSLHGAYEFLMSVKNVNVTDQKIDYLFTGSSVYEKLYEETDEYLKSHFAPQRVKSIYFHEVVNWLRLIPYKVAKDYHTAPAFYAALVMILNDVFEKFPEGENNE